MRLILFAATIGLLGPLAGVAQEAAPTPGVQQRNAVAPASPGDGQAEAGGDRTKADDMGATGWGGSWSANEGSQADDAGTATTDRAMPLPEVPSAPVPGTPTR